MPRTTPYGFPLRVAPRSATTMLLIEPTLGYRADQPPTDLLPGQTPQSVNFLRRDGRLVPRPRLSAVTANANPMGVAVTGGAEIVSSNASVFPLISGTTRLAWFSNASWSVLSYVSSAGRSTPPSGSTTDYYDITQVYLPAVDDNIAILACQSYQTLFAWQSGTTIFSTLTTAPQARYVTTADNFVLTLNVRDASASSRYVQRVQWSARGNPSNWTNPDAGAGFEDLLDAKGEGTRIMRLGNRVAVFFEREIWYGYRAAGTAPWLFDRLDPTVGTAYSWTVAETPIGLIFLGNDFMLYLLPKEGGAATPIGHATQGTLRDTITNPTLAHAVYDEQWNIYRLFYPVRGKTGVPTEELAIDLQTLAVAPQTYDNATGRRSITRAFSAFLQSAPAGLSWSDVSTAGYTWATLPFTWAQMSSAATRVGRTLFAGSSNGTVFHMDSSATRDDGTPVLATWRSHGFAGDSPEAVKLIQEVRADYEAASSSAFTVRVSPDQGATFGTGQSVSVVATSGVSQAQSFHNTTSRYPMFEVQTMDQGLKFGRFWVKARLGGR